MIGNNIKTARMAHGLSLQELSEKLTASGFPTTKATLSNYETGRYVPNEEAIKAIARETFTQLGFFYNDNDQPFELKFFLKPDLVDRKDQYLEAFIIMELQRFKYVDDLLNIKVDWKPTEIMHIDTGDKTAIENLSYRFRSAYSAGSHAIASVCDILERRGWHIFSMPDFCTETSCISGYDMISGVPFILYRPEGYQDEMRLSLLRSVGYSLIEGSSPQETEQIIDHFARAVLMPENIARSIFGGKRTKITDPELITTKRMYGLGKKYIMKRLSELSIISHEIYSRYMRYILERYDMVRSSGLLDDSMFFEMPTTYDMRVARINAEGLGKIQILSVYSEELSIT